MLNIKRIIRYIVDYLEAYDDKNETLEGGIYRFLEDFKASLGNGESNELTYDKFVKFNRSCLCFDTEYARMVELLATWGKCEDKITDVEMDFYSAIWPYLKAVLEDYNNGPKIYTAYAEKDDITFVMQETKINGGKETKVEVIGFYYGEPNEAHTKEYAKNHNLVAILDV